MSDAVQPSDLAQPSDPVKATVPRRVVFVGSTGNWAGAQSTLHLLLDRLDLERWDPRVVLPNNGRFQTRLEDLGVPVTFARTVVWIDQRRACTWERFSPGLADRVQALTDHLAREAPALVVSNSSVVLEGALAAKRLDLPHIWRVHEMLARHDNFGPALPLSTYPALLDALSDRVSVVSGAVRDVLSSSKLAAAALPEERIAVIPNGLDVLTSAPTSRSDRLGFEPRGPVVVFVGTVSAAKGVPALAGVMRRVRARFPDARCLLVGRDVGGRAELLAKARGLEDTFVFAGFRSDAASIIGAADALILPSKVDSLPCVVMEAMAAGVPSVATRSGGAEDLIVDGETGYLAAIGDEPAMAAALCRLFEDAERRREMGRAARQRLERLFSAERYAHACEALFDDVCERPDRLPGRAAVDTLIGRIEAAAGERTSAGAERALASALDRMRAPSH